MDRNLSSHFYGKNINGPKKIEPLNILGPTDEWSKIFLVDDI